MLTRCPHCFVQLHTQHYAFRCTNPACEEGVDLPLSTYRGSEERGRTVVDVGGLAGGHPTSATCSACGATAAQEVCPECHYDLVPGWRWCTTTCIAMAGARASGKSIYIAVLKQQAELWSERYGRALSPLDARTGETYERVYQRPLYSTRNLLQVTPSAQTRLAPQREPLLFDMGQIGEHPHVLVLRDVAGEDLEDRSTVPGPFQFFARADAVAFLFDPMRLDSVRGQLEGVVPPQMLSGGDPVQVLGNLVRLMRGGAAFGQPLRTPFALVVAKFDTLAELADVEGGPLSAIMDNAGAAFNRDPSMEHDFDAADARLLEAEVESLLVRLQARSLLNLADASFLDRQLFAVSALGHLPADAETVSPRGIAPFRVLDPLKWALSRTGVIGVT